MLSAEKAQDFGDSSRCGCCGGPTETLVHRFFVGNPERPEKTWDVRAPLHFIASDDNRSMLVGFCSARCGLEFRRAARLPMAAFCV